MSSANYLNTNSSSNTKTSASEGTRVLIENYNLPVSQSVTLNSDLKHETLIIPSTSMPAWGAFHVLNLNSELHFVIQVNYNSQLKRAILPRHSFLCLKKNLYLNNWLKTYFICIYINKIYLFSFLFKDRKSVCRERVCR